MNSLLVKAMLKRRRQLPDCRGTLGSSSSSNSSSSSSRSCLRTPADMYLLSLLLARTCVALFVMPARILGLYSTEGIGELICELCTFAATGSAATSVLSTCAVCVSKIAQLKIATTPSNKSIWISVVALWILGYVYAVREPFLNGIVTRENSKGDVIFVCAELPKYRSLTAVFLLCDVAMLFLVPTLIVVFGSVYYIKLTSKLAKTSPSKQKVNPSTKVSSGSDTKGTPNGKHPSNDDSRHESSSSKPAAADVRYMSLIIMLLFVGCYVTTYLWKVLMYLGLVDNLSVETALHVEQAMFFWTFLNPLLNSGVYLYFRPDLRDNFISIFVCKQSENAIACAKSTNEKCPEKKNTVRQIQNWMK